MAVPRPVLLALLGIALCAAAFLATRGAQDPSGEITVAPTPTPVAPKKSDAGPAPKQARETPAPAPKPAERNEAQSAAERALQGAEATARQVSGQSKPEPVAPAERSAHETAVEVTRALGDGEVVVFFFTHHGAADDQQTRQAVATLQGLKDVMIVQAGLKDLADYRPVLAGAGVSQVPSIVIVHADKPARLIEGYVDRGTLRQAVADALR
jgi:uncharacterized protein involved in type VI secretion and phage assembly